MIDDKDSLLEIPEFLKRKPRNRVSKKYKPKSIKQKWWMPNLVLYKKQREDRELRKKEITQEKVLKKKRKQKKLTIESSLLDIISRGHNTFGKIRNYFKCIEKDTIEDKDIRNALNRLVKNNKLIKATKRIYKLNV
tara:strand:+ start:234 stop:641 length:408 start_codon:yes stop_codon:yes gene_type:complete